MKRVGFHTLGCKVNQYETESMEEEFIRAGYRLVDFEEAADIYIVNTCTVTNISDRKSRQFIRRAKKNNPASLVAVTGCYSQVSPEEIEAMEEVDIVLGTNNKRDIVKICQEALETRQKLNLVDDIKYQKDFQEMKIEDMKEQTRAYIKIQEGCNQFCSYCIIPYARGPIRSREIDSVIAEVIRLVENGYKEIVLTGIHVASYGIDLSRKDYLIELIDGLGQIEGLERIRFSSLEVSIITDDFLEALVRSKKACDHFHLSLQSGSDTVLNRMNRKYSSEEYSEKVDLIRSYMPEAGITTDIIVGFPGETDREFKETMDFVEKIKFSRIHVFKYSKREGTPAASMAGQVDGNIKNQRSEELIGLAESLERDFMKAYLGRELSVLMEEDRVDSDYMEGYTSNYIRVRSLYDPALVGQIVDLRADEIQDGVILARPK